MQRLLVDAVEHTANGGLAEYLAQQMADRVEILWLVDVLAPQPADPGHVLLDAGQDQLGHPIRDVSVNKHRQGDAAANLALLLARLVAHLLLTFGTRSRV